jgi:hypothetical protein
MHAMPSPEIEAMAILVGSRGNDRSVCIHTRIAATDMTEKSRTPVNAVVTLHITVLGWDSMVSVYQRSQTVSLFERLAGLTCDKSGARVREVSILDSATPLSSRMYLAQESMHAWCAFMPIVSLTEAICLMLISREISS